MKILVISDIHGNIDALDAVYNRESDADQIWFAGDFVDYGPFPKEVVRWCAGHDVIAVRGNHDDYLLVADERSRHQPVEGSGHRKWLDYTREQLSAEDIEYLASVPESVVLEADGFTYVMRHMFNGYDLILGTHEFEPFWEEFGGPKDTDQKRVILGHTHRQGLHLLGDGDLWLNPGSVSYRRPDETDKRAHYAVIEDGVIELRRLSFDRSRALRVSLEEVVKGSMLETELQDAMFFFGDAPTTRSPLPTPAEASALMEQLGRRSDG